MTKEEHYSRVHWIDCIPEWEDPEICGKFLQLQMFQLLEWDIYLIIDAHQIIGF